jgi:hypothetical protein
MYIPLDTILYMVVFGAISIGVFYGIAKLSDWTSKRKEQGK